MHVPKYKNNVQWGLGTDFNLEEKQLQKANLRATWRLDLFATQKLSSSDCISFKNM